MKAATGRRTPNMPELPEVEVRLRFVRRSLIGERIERAVVLVPGLIKCPSPPLFARSLRGRRMIEASRRGKYLIIGLDDNRSLLLHFGMGGDLHLYRKASERPPYTRIEFFLGSGHRLAFTCPRNICRVMLVRNANEIPGIGTMGPEPLDRRFNRARFGEIISAGPRACIKPLLMDQKRIAGVGNIYADQILFRARVRPDRISASLTEDEIARLHRETKNVLRRAVRVAHEDEFPSSFLASRRARGLRCPRCGGEIATMKLNGRTSHYCGHCQR